MISRQARTRCFFLAGPYCSGGERLGPNVIDKRGSSTEKLVILFQIPYLLQHFAIFVAALCHFRRSNMPFFVAAFYHFCRSNMPFFVAVFYHFCRTIMFVVGIHARAHAHPTPAVDFERRAGSVHGSRAEQQPRPQDDQALATGGR